MIQIFEDTREDISTTKEGSPKGEKSWFPNWIVFLLFLIAQALTPLPLSIVDILTSGSISSIPLLQVWLSNYNALFSTNGPSATPLGFVTLLLLPNILVSAVTLLVLGRRKSKGYFTGALLVTCLILIPTVFFGIMITS
ncbi:MAG: hypothetical protein OK457_12025 [Thaumarchaeota archaeon]|nr:hypothetical protein [Nitrososphaerota archaeon]